MTAIVLAYCQDLYSPYDKLCSRMSAIYQKEDVSMNMFLFLVNFPWRKPYIFVFEHTVNCTLFWSHRPFWLGVLHDVIKMYLSRAVKQAGFIYLPAYCCFIKLPWLYLHLLLQRRLIFFCLVPHHSQSLWSWEMSLSNVAMWWHQDHYTGSS